MARLGQLDLAPDGVDGDALDGACVVRVAVGDPGEGREEADEDQDASAVREGGFSTHNEQMDVSKNLLRYGELGGTLTGGNGPSIRTGHESNDQADVGKHDAGYVSAPAPERPLVPAIDVERALLAGQVANDRNSVR